jgi:NADH-quinone oxidoreductase subunit M
MADLRDLQPRELLAAVPLATGLLILGMIPAPVIALMSATVTQLAAIFTSLP